MSGAASEFWTAECVRAAMGAVWHAHPRDGTDPRGGASIDTRSLAPGEIFFALRGERVDGHAYLEQAHHAGAALAVIDDAEQAGETPPGLPVVRVADARAALGRLAAAYRRRLSATRFIAVTGSNGKTTTTRMIHACLGDRLRGRCSPGSYNNDLGVPLTILAARPGDQYVICEVGANAPGEIEPLSGMIQPDVVVITSIGRAHLEGFGSIECIAREKLSLASHLAPGGVVFLCADAPHLHELAAPLKRRVTFGRSASADLRVEGILHVPGGIRFSINERAEFTLPLSLIHI